MVIEVGVGSGVFIIFLVNVVGLMGKVISYEVRKDFYEIVKKNVELVGFFDWVVLKNKSIYDGIDEKEVDYIVFDFF